MSDCRSIFCNRITTNCNYSWNNPWDRPWLFKFELLIHQNIWIKSICCCILSTPELIYIPHKIPSNKWYFRHAGWSHRRWSINCPMPIIWATTFLKYGTSILFWKWENRIVLWLTKLWILFGNLRNIIRFFIRDTFVRKWF